MRVLILGNSGIARKRVLPALAAMPEIDAVEVASLRSGDSADIDYSDYELALAQSKAGLVYVSLVNSDHAHWTERALESGRHVIVDHGAAGYREQSTGRDYA